MRQKTKQLGRFVEHQKRGCARRRSQKALMQDEDDGGKDKDVNDDNACIDATQNLFSIDYSKNA